MAHLFESQWIAVQEKTFKKWYAAGDLESLEEAMLTLELAGLTAK